MADQQCRRKGLMWYKPDSEGPPNLDEMLGRFLNGKKTKSGGTSGGFQLGNFKFVVSILVVLLLLSGFFVIKPAERAVILRLGRYVTTYEPGPHWLPPLLYSRYIVDVQKIFNFSHSDEMLTKDENIVFVSVAVWYRINDAKAYLFHVKNPEISIQQATASALRQVVGHTKLDDILTGGRAEATVAIEKQLKEVLARYHTGLSVTEVTLQPAKPPEAVTAAFDDAIKAREDEVRYVNQAKAYQRKVIPVAEGKAARITQEAGAYAKQVVLAAKAEVAPYLALLAAHNKQPKLTDYRLYMQTFESIFSRVHKVLLADNAKANLTFLPFDPHQVKQSIAQVTGQEKPLVFSPQLPAVKQQPVVNTHRTGYSEEIR